MAKKKQASNERKGRPAMTPKEREDELIGLAIGLAEQQLRDGTASTQVIVHYLKLGSTRGMLENEKLAKETELVCAKTESVQASKKNDELYENALKAMSLYSGRGVEDAEEL